MKPPLIILTIMLTAVMGCSKESTITELETKQTNFKEIQIVIFDKLRKINSPIFSGTTFATKVIKVGEHKIKWKYVDSVEGADNFLVTIDDEHELKVSFDGTAQKVYENDRFLATIQKVDPSLEHN